MRREEREGYSGPAEIHLEDGDKLGDATVTLGSWVNIIDDDGTEGSRGWAGMVTGLPDSVLPGPLEVMVTIRSNRPLPFLLNAYLGQAAAYEQLFTTAAERCEPPPSPDTLDRARGHVAWRIANNQRQLEKLSNPYAASEFCAQLQATEDITPTAVAEASGALNLVKGGSKNVVGLGVSVLILNCHQVLDDFRA